MKTIYLLLCCFFTVSASAQYRKVDGQIYSYGDPNAGWVLFSEPKLVLGFTREGVTCQSFHYQNSTQRHFDGHNTNPSTTTKRILGQIFVLKNYPYEKRLNIGDEIQESVFAMRVFLKNTSAGAENREQSGYVYDMGVPWTPPPRILTPAEKLQASNKKIEKDKKVFIWLESQATNGSVSAQCSLGEHYLNGIGTDTNRAAGIEWLQKASAQGDVESSNLLLQISEANTNSMPQ